MLPKASRNVSREKQDVNSKYEVVLSSGDIQLVKSREISKESALTVLQQLNSENMLFIF